MKTKMIKQSQHHYPATDIAANRQSSRQSNRQRGAILIFVVVAITMLAILGAAYLQVVRVQRARTTPIHGNMKAEIAAIISQISDTLTNDLKGSTASNGKLELYDYPWTNKNAAWNVQGYYSNTINAMGNTDDDTWLASSEPNSAGSQWPHLSNLNGYYLSYNGGTNNFNMNGQIPVELAVTDASAGSINSDTDQTINVSSPGQLVDADGDGIPDSRWTWGALPDIGPVKYVMAVRIVDLSSKVNVNTATSLINSGGTYDTSAAGTDAPRWDSPAEIDFGQFVSGVSGALSAFQNNVLRYRMNAATSLPVPYVDASNSVTTRYGDWLHQGSFYGASATNLTGTLYDPADSSGNDSFDNLYELLRDNGLSQDSSQGASDVKIEKSSNGMPNLLRENTGSSGGETSYTTTPYSNVSSYFNNEPRHQITTASGAAVFAWPTAMSGASANFSPNDSSDNDYKLDLNYQLCFSPNRPLNRTNLFNGLTNLRDRIKSVYDMVGTSCHDIPGSMTTSDFATQVAVSLYDYADADDKNALTEYYESNTRDFFGMEALPFITEVYAEGKYPNPSTTGSTASEWDLHWALQGHPGFAIEIRNPFSFPISLDHVYLYIGNSNGKNQPAPPTGGWGGRSLVALAGKKILQPKEVLVLYQNAGDGTAANDKTGQAPMVTQETTSGYTYTYRQIPVGTYTWPTQTGVTRNQGAAVPTLTTTFVELRVSAVSAKYGNPPNISGAALITYDRMTTTQIPASYEDKSISTSTMSTAPTSGPYYWQVDRSGDGRGIMMLAMTGGDGNTSTPSGQLKVNDMSVLEKPNSSTPQFDATIPELGKANKGNAFANANSHRNLLTQQIIFADQLNSAGDDVLGRGYIAQPGELMHLSWLAPNRYMTVAETWKKYSPNQSNVNAFLLNFSPNTNTGGDLLTNNATGTPPDGYKVTPATFLLSQFTTLSPRVDGLNNDGDGGKDANDPHHDENIVNGLINLNTAPKSLLEKILPIADPTLRTDVAQWIIDYRQDDAAQRAAVEKSAFSSGYPTQPDASEFRNNPGIAYTGELEKFLEGELAQNSSSFSGTIKVNQKDTASGAPTSLPVDVASINSTRAQFISDQSVNLRNYDGTMHFDRAALATTLTRWLGTVATTRSDYFAAYVTVRGYKPSGFQKADILEEAQFIAIFRRNFSSGKIQVTALLPNGSTSVPYMVKSP